MGPEILVADVDPATRATIARALVGAGYYVRTTGTAAMLWRWLHAREGDLVLAGATLPDEDTFKLIAHVKKLRPGMPTIIMTENGDLATAVRAHECGAYDYALMPLTADNLLHIVKRATSGGLPGEGKKIFPRKPSIGGAPVMDAIDGALERLSKTDITVILSGEFGVGKSFAARALHERGQRAGMPFVSFNVAAFPSDIVEEELFGREGCTLGVSDGCALNRIQQAEGGTLFLAEIGGMSMSAQARLVSVLQRGEFVPVGDCVAMRCNVRIIMAAREDARALVETGRLRDDLLSCDVALLKLPPLRDHAEDIPALMDYFSELCVCEGLPRRRMERAALERLMSYRWPGNLRELRDLVRRLALLHPDEIVGANTIERELVGDRAYSEHCGKNAQDLEAACLKSLSKLVEDAAASALSDTKGPRVTTGLYHRIVRQVEAQLFSNALVATRGHQIAAARLLGISRDTLRKKSLRRIT